MRFTKLFHKLIRCKKRYVILQGGTSSSKTCSMLQLLYLKAQKYQGIHISIVSESLPHLKKGAMRDFFRMLKEDNLYDESSHNKTDNIYKSGESLRQMLGNKDLMQTLMRSKAVFR